MEFGSWWAVTWWKELKLAGTGSSVKPHPMLSTLDHHGQRPPARVVGSGNGRFALAVDQKHWNMGTSSWRRIFLVDPRAGKEIELVSPPRVHEDECVRKIVFAPNQNYDWTVVALCNRDKLAYIDGKVDRKWTTTDVIDRYLVDLAFYDAGHDLHCYCLDSRGGVHALRTPRGYLDDQLTLVWRCDFDPATFAKPYDVVYKLTSTKHIFFCHGNMYQVWQNNSCNVSSGTGISGCPPTRSSS
ncbi:hypothetical protein VPH35_034521 [Triticum aestivum]|uniref:KIB1-4 beta-propeller domain-containing protein n=1 Tax=Aegilops tauschii TaxID=37682 RepID=M8CY34_AEGTA